MPFPFLNLPPELRSEIYNLLLLFPIPETFDDNQPSWISRYWQLSQLNSFDPKTICRKSGVLSLFLTCRQIHEEASEVFYGRNAWPIKITMARGGMQVLDCDDMYNVAYESPWEEVAYSGPADGSVGKYYDTERFFHAISVGELEKKQLIIGGHPKTGPGLRYRRFLRDIRIVIMDNRTCTLGYDDFKEEEELNGARTLLLPFMGKLRELMGSAKGNVKIVIARQEKRMISLWSDEAQEWYLGLAREKKKEVQDHLSLVSYTQLVEAAWPLTQGTWRWEIDMGTDDQLYGDYREPIWENCGRYPEFSRDVMRQFENVAVAGDCYYAKIDSMVRLVRNGMRYSCCYGCETRELEKARGHVDAPGEIIDEGETEPDMSKISRPARKKSVLSRNIPRY